MREALARCRHGLWVVFALTAVVNVLMLSSSMYMLQVYDRVLPSRSIPTLVALSVVLVLMYVLLGVFDWARQRILTRIGMSLDRSLSAPVLGAILRLTSDGKGSAGVQPSRDLDSVRGFLSSLGPTAFADLPWIPLYLGICFLLHPLLGWTLVAGAVALILLTILTELRTRAPNAAAARTGTQRAVMLEAARRNAEVIQALGMERRIADRFALKNAQHIGAQQTTTDVTLGIGTVSKVLRFILQSATLGVGAWLVIRGEASPGVMIASSIMTSRALAPIELSIAHWKSFITARGAWRRLSEVLAAAEVEPAVMPSPACRQLTVQGIVVAAPGGKTPILQNVGFSAEAGQTIGIIGPSASGKSSLVRAITGVWAPVRGEIRLDGATLDQWPAEIRGGMIGYLPQDIELFDGTVAENIARFDPAMTSADVQAAAEAAGAHEMILKLAAGYETGIGEGGSVLSGGQRQRIALARALYKDPFLIVLDEPNSNLDGDGEAALTRAMRTVAERGGIVLIVAHRASALAGVDLVLSLQNGQVQAFGPRDEVLRKVTAPRGGAPLKAVATQPAVSERR